MQQLVRSVMRVLAGGVATRRQEVAGRLAANRKRT